MIFVMSCRLSVAGGSGEIGEIGESGESGEIGGIGGIGIICVNLCNLWTSSTPICDCGKKSFDLVLRGKLVFRRP